MDWFFNAQTTDGTEVPPSVIDGWRLYAHSESRARTRHAILEMASLLTTAAIPACAAFDVEASWIAALGSVAIVINGGRQLFGWKESWANRRKVRYAIEREVALFVIGAGRYAEEHPEKRLVEVVEEMLSEEREDWHSRRIAFDPSNLHRSSTM
jgi:hypothetical protein